jgi:hypothetical protein
MYSDAIRSAPIKALPLMMVFESRGEMASLADIEIRVSASAVRFDHTLRDNVNGSVKFERGVKSVQFEEVVGPRSSRNLHRCEFCHRASLGSGFRLPGLPAMTDAEVPQGFLTMDSLIGAARAMSLGKSSQTPSHRSYAS